MTLANRYEALKSEHRSAPLRDVQANQEAVKALHEGFGIPAGHVAPKFNTDE